MTTTHERDRFAAVYEDAYPRILAYARRRSDSIIAEDLAAEVFARAWRLRSSMPTHELPWLYGIARNVVLEHYRSRDRLAAVTAAAAGRAERQLAAANATDGTADAVDLRLDLEAALRSLSFTDQEILTLHAWEGLAPREIATVIGVTGATARVSLHRARRRLAAALAAAPTAAPATAPTTAPAPTHSRSRRIPHHEQLRSR